MGTPEPSEAKVTYPRPLLSLRASSLGHIQPPMDLGSKNMGEKWEKRWVDSKRSLQVPGRCQAGYPQEHWTLLINMGTSMKFNPVEFLLHLLEGLG